MVVVKIVEISAEDVEELALISDVTGDCVSVMDAARSLELWALELVEDIELALLCSPTKIPATIPSRPGMGACGASSR